MHVSVMATPSSGSGSQGEAQVNCRRRACTLLLLAVSSGIWTIYVLSGCFLRASCKHLSIFRSREAELKRVGEDGVDFTRKTYKRLTKQVWRTADNTSRLPWKMWCSIFHLPLTHPQPKSLSSISLAVSTMLLRLQKQSEIEAERQRIREHQRLIEQARLDKQQSELEREWQVMFQFQ